jgi:hypothetical protein
MHPLSEIENGAIGLIYWYEKTSYEMDEKEIEKLRQKNISDTLNATLMNHMYEPSKAIGDMQTVMQRGWNEAEKQRKMIEDGTEMKHEIFMIGDPNTIPRIKEIETSPNFRGWSNDYIISEIKNLEC